jgi:hypothetical protein
MLRLKPHVDEALPNWRLDWRSDWRLKVHRRGRLSWRSRSLGHLHWPTSKGGRWR